MQPMTVADLGELINESCSCQILGDSTVLVGPDVVRDNRDATRGALFVAISGEHFDGAQFAEDAVARGAAAVIANADTGAKVPHLIVDNSIAGLTALASAHIKRQIKRGLFTFGITGSAGKTSTKDLLAQVLEHVNGGHVVSPVGSFNNEIGAPLTACRVDEDTDYLVSEMGADGFGHIKALCQVIPPKVAVIVNVGTAHLGRFGSRDGIAKAKSEIIRALKPGDHIVLNADDDYFRYMLEIADEVGANVAVFSVNENLKPQAEIAVIARKIKADDLDRHSFDLEFHIRGQVSTLPVQLNLVGRAQALDAVAAATAAVAAGCKPSAIAEGLNKAVVRSRWRMELTELAGGAAIINDAYNSNPNSAASAVDALAEIGARRKVKYPTARTFIVLGDMLELGDQAAQLHRELGRHAAQVGIDEVMAVGEFAEDIVAGAKSLGGNAQICQSDQIASNLALRLGDVALVKASRGLALEKVCDAVIAKIGVR